MRELIFQEIRNKKMSVNDAWAPTIVMQFYNKHCKNMDYSDLLKQLDKLCKEGVFTKELHLCGTQSFLYRLTKKGYEVIYRK